MLLISVSFVVSISLLVFIHELGHYFAAVYSGVKVEEFSVGFGKEIFSFHDKRGTTWKVGLIPLGGYVKMKDFGQDFEDNKKSSPDSFFNKSPLIKAWIVFAGPLMNYVIGFFIIALIYFFNGTVKIPAIIDFVEENSPASIAGMLRGDEITHINNVAIDSFSDLQKYLITNLDKQISLNIKRNTELIVLYINPLTTYSSIDQSNRKTKRGYIGVKPVHDFYKVELSLLESFKMSLFQVIDITKMSAQFIKQLVFTRERNLSELNGVITLGEYSYKAISAGILYYLSFFAYASINIGFMNLLPIPVLDGGHLLLYLFEFFSGKTISSVIRNIITRIGLLIITFFIVLSVFNDIKHLLF